MSENERQDNQERSPEEIRTLKLLMAKIARLFSGTHQITTVPGKGWACGFKDSDRVSQLISGYIKGEITEEQLDSEPSSTFIPTSIIYDESWFKEKALPVIKGVLRHEIGHARHSDYRLLAKGQRSAAQDGYLPTSYLSAQNPIEDLWVNNRESDESDLVREEMRALYASHLEGLLEEMRSKGSSLNRQLGVRQMLDWMRDELGLTDQATLDTLDREFLDKRAVEAHQKTLDACRRFINPRNSAAENFRIMHDEIWPIARELEVQDLKDEVIKQLTKPQEGQPQENQGQPGQGQPGEGQGQGQPSQGQGSPSQSPGQGQPGQGRPGGGKPQPGQPSQGQGSGGENPLISKLPPNLQERLRKEMAKQQAQTTQGIQGQTREQIAEAHQDAKPQPKSGEGLDPRDIPDDLKKAVQEAIEKNLTPEERAQLEGQAKAELDEKQAQEIAKDQPKGMEMVKDEETGQYIQKPKTGDPEEAQEKKRELEKFEHEDRKDQEAKREETAKEIREAKTKEEVDKALDNPGIPEDFKEELRQQAENRKQALDQEHQRKVAQMKNEGFEEHEEALFDELQELERAAKQGLDRFVEKVAEFLPKKVDYDWEEGHRSGKKLIRKDLPRKIPTGQIDIFGRRTEVLGNEPKMFVKLIVDSSGSMGGSKMNESMKTAFFFANALVEFGIPFSVTFFDTDTETTMEFGEKFDKKGSRVKVKTMRASKRSGSSTNIEKVLREADKELIQARKRYPNCLSSIMFIGDGGANEGATGETLKSLVDEIKTRHITTAYALGAQGQELKKYFGEGEDCTIEADEFGSDLLGKAKTALKKVLRRTAKHFNQK